VPTTSADLTTRAKVLYDVAGSAVLSNPEWVELLNDSYRKLWRTVTRINKTFRINVDTFTLTTSQTRALPSDYRETFAVRLNPGTDQVVVLQRLTIRRASYAFDRSFRLQGANLYIEPIQRCAGTYDHLYIPNVTPLAAARDIDMDPGDDTSDGAGLLHFDQDNSFTVADIGRTLTLANTTDPIDSIDYTITSVVSSQEVIVSPAPPVNVFAPTTTATVCSVIDAELDQFAAFLVYDAANVALAREESDRLYEIDFQREEAAVIAWASSQRSAEPDVVEDVRGRASWWARGMP
jgi:hypothetical protein